MSQNAGLREKHAPTNPADGETQAPLPSLPRLEQMSAADAADPANRPTDNASDIGARQVFLSKEDFFMATAVLAAQQSRDPNTQVGACLVDREGRLVSLGYNRLPPNCDAKDYPWGRSSDCRDEPLKNKSLYVCHAELSAVMDGRSADLAGGTIYVTLFPCSHCAGLIILARLSKVIFLSDKYHDRPEYEASRRLLDCAGIEYRCYKPTFNHILLNMLAERPSVLGSTG